MPDAVVIGAGANGLVAANLLADRGWDVLVLEAEDEPGGAVRSAPLTGDPAFVHDVFSAFHPFAVASPAIGGLDLEQHGLEWCRAPIAAAHPAEDGTCAVVSRDLGETMASLDAFAPGDGEAWRRLYATWERVGPHVADALVTPLPPIRPAARIAAELGPDVLRLARLLALPMRRLAEEEFRGAGAERLLAGHAAHGDLAPEVPPSAAFAWVLASLGQEHGFPTPRGGAGQLTAALVRRLRARGGTLRCGAPVTRVLVRGRAATGVELRDGERIEARRAVLADVAAPALYRDLVGAEHLPAGVLADIARFAWDWATVKVDWALDGPIPWATEPTRRAGVIHVAEDLDEMTMSAAQIATGRVPARPFLVAGQYAPVDPTRAPPGADVAWAYTHVPRTVRGDAGDGGITGAWATGDGERLAERIEARIDALAPGFRDLVRARHVLTPPDFERLDRSLVSGSMHGATTQIHQQAIFRPVPRSLGRPETPGVARLYLASASAHPGGGVHGGPGAIAARAAIAGDVRRRLRALPRRVRGRTGPADTRRSG